MKQRIDRLSHQFVKFIPDELDDAVLYISILYKTASHKCACGCGERVVTPISPAQWELTYNGDTVSLEPSIAGGKCKSHYFITRGRIRWGRQLTSAEEAVALRRDTAALKRLSGVSRYTIEPVEAGRAQKRRRIWAAIGGWIERRR